MGRDGFFFSLTELSSVFKWFLRSSPRMMKCWVSGFAALHFVCSEHFCSEGMNDKFFSFEKRVEEKMSDLLFYNI